MLTQPQHHVENRNVIRSELEKAKISIYRRLHRNRLYYKAIAESAINYEIENCRTKLKHTFFTIHDRIVLTQFTAETLKATEIGLEQSQNDDSERDQRVFS